MPGCRWCQGKSQPISQTDSLRAAIERVGYPALIKPAAGGGGIGMKVVRTPSEVAGRPGGGAA